MKSTKFLYTYNWSHTCIYQSIHSALSVLLFYACSLHVIFKLIFKEAHLIVAWIWQMISGGLPLILGFLKKYPLIATPTIILKYLKMPLRQRQSRRRRLGSLPWRVRVRWRRLLVAVVPEGPPSLCHIGLWRPAGGSGAHQLPTQSNQVSTQDKLFSQYCHIFHAIRRTINKRSIINNCFLYIRRTAL